jgi:hypothetical protein
MDGVDPEVSGAVDLRTGVAEVGAEAGNRPDTARQRRRGDGGGGGNPTGVLAASAVAHV